jgi:hypothetical protein
MGRGLGLTSLEGAHGDVYALLAVFTFGIGIGAVALAHRDGHGVRIHAQSRGLRDAGTCVRMQ